MKFSKYPLVRLSLAFYRHLKTSTSMKYVYSSLIVLFFCSDLSAQKYTFELKSYNTNRKIRLYKKNPEIYHVTYGEMTAVVTEREEQETEVYKTLVGQIAMLQDEQNSDLGDASIFKETLLINIPKIIVQLHKFNNSNLPYELKKNHLLKAQNLIELSRLSYMAYADLQVNSAKLSKFSSLKEDPLALQNHLNTIITDLKKQSKLLNESETPDILCLDDDVVNSTAKIAELKAQLKDVPRYETKNTDTKSYSKMSYKLQRKVTNPNELFGTFVQQKEDFYVMSYDYQKFKRDELLDSETMSKNDMTLKQMTFPEAKKLIRNKSTNEYYLVSKDFSALFGYLKPKTGLARNSSTTTTKKTSSIVQKRSTQTASIPAKNLNLVTTIKYKSNVVLDPEFEYTNSALASYQDAIASSERLTNKLEGHYQALLAGKMSSTRAREWKKDINKAEKLYETLTVMTSTYDTSIKDFNKNMNPKFKEYYNDFTKTLSSAKQASGYK